MLEQIQSYLTFKEALSMDLKANQVFTNLLTNLLGQLADIRERVRKFNEEPGTTVDEAEDTGKRNEE